MADDSEVQRQAFEAMMKAPPFNRICLRHAHDSAWPGQYVSLSTQLAWEAWQRAVEVERSKPVPALLFCPVCKGQHIDAPETHHVDQALAEAGMGEDYAASWDNPPHRSHLCHYCGCIWRAADVPTTGVYHAQSRGKADTFDVSKAPTVVAGQANITAYQWPEFEVVQKWALENGYSGASDDDAYRAYKDAHPHADGASDASGDVTA